MSRLTEAELRAKNDLDRARIFGRGESVAALTESQRQRDVSDLRRIGLSREAAERGAAGLQRGTYGSVREAAAMASTFTNESSVSRHSSAMVDVIERERIALAEVAASSEVRS